MYNRRDLREWFALFRWSQASRCAGGYLGHKLQPPPRFALRAQPLDRRGAVEVSEPLDCIRIRTLAVCAWLRRCLQRHFGQLGGCIRVVKGVREGGTSAAEERGKRGRRRLGREWREQRAATLRTKRRCTAPTAVTKGATGHRTSRGDCCSGQGGSRDGQRSTITRAVGDGEGCCGGRIHWTGGIVYRRGRRRRRGRGLWLWLSLLAGEKAAKD